jgi:putative transposase
MRQEMQMQGGGLTIREMCESARVSRASYYRSWRKREPKQEEMALRDAIQRLAVQDRHYGYRRIVVSLHREGWVVNHKRVLRLMRQDNLLSIRRRRFVVTTDSDHRWRVYPNVARRMVATDIDQLWVADITFVRLQQEFIYVAVILDVYSRRVVGWSISRCLDSRFALQALETALKQRRPLPGLIHHSDRGVQYACGEYVERLEACGVTISMSRPGNPYDNAWAESFMKTLKVEEVNGRRYRHFEDAASSIGAFIEEIYNPQRLHSALGYRSPMEFETEVSKQNVFEFLKKEKSSKKERKLRKGRPVETAAAEEIQKRRPSAPSS